MILLLLVSCGSEVTADEPLSKKEEIQIVQQQIQKDLNCIHEKLDCMTLMVEKTPIPEECEKYLVSISE
jgi:hypothetical protein